MAEVRADNWTGGINNVARPDRIPAGSVRDLVNLDPADGGTLEARAGYRKVMAGTELRGAFALGRQVVAIDGGVVRAYSPDIDEAADLGSIAVAGPVAGTVLNGQLYLNTLTDSLRTDGVNLTAWDVPAPAFEVAAIPGGALSGRHRVAVTALGASGEESGGRARSIDLPEGSSLRVASLDGRPLRIYASAQDSAALYYQGVLIAGVRALTRIDDTQERMTTEGLIGLPRCTELATYNGVILGRLEDCVFFTLPMWPHLMDPVSGYFRFGGKVRLLAPTDAGVFVVADKTYFISLLETDKPVMRTALEMDGVEGSAVRLPDGRAVWMTRYGQAIGTPDGLVTLPNRATFAPSLAAHAAAGVLDHNGIQMVVTTMRGVTSANNLTAGDFADLET